MSKTDILIQEEFLPFCQRVVEAFERNHHAMFLTFMTFISGENKIGMQITDNGTVVGDYTLVLSNIHFSRIENGVLSSHLSTPFGVIKPYYIIEKRTIEDMIKDEKAFVEHPFKTKLRYLSDVTIKFLK